MLGYYERIDLKRRVSAATRRAIAAAAPAPLAPEPEGTCAIEGCPNDIVPPLKHGRPPLYCSKRCANAAWRARQRTACVSPT